MYRTREPDTEAIKGLMMRTIDVRRLGAALAVGFALLATACGGGNGDTGGDTNGTTETGEIEVEASEFRFQPSNISVAAGEFTVVLENTGSQEHDFLIEGVDDPDAEHLIHAMPGESASGDYELEAGSYTFYCSIPGHRESGMEGSLRVT
jgi:plastocyanin